MSRPIIYTQEQLDWVKANCTLVLSELHAQFCQVFDRHDVSAVNLNALRKRNGWKTGRTGRFEKGHASHKGGPGGPNRTSFKKGHAPANVRPLYSERVSKTGYIEIKVPEPNPYTGAPTRFRQKHVWLWEQANGPVPPKHAVVFKDGNKLNCVLENLACVHRRVLQAMNQNFKVSEYPEEVRPSILAVSQLTAEIHHRKNERTTSKGDAK